MKRKLGALLTLLLFVAVLSACSNYQFKPTTKYDIADFTATDHRGDEVSLESLKGEPWLTMFIFTNCTTICSPMTSNMAQIQQQLEEKGVKNYKIVPFSIDPASDTPERLTEYLGRHGAPDESKWHMLTGYDQKFIEQLAKGSFKTPVQMFEGNDQVMHAETIFLVDEQGVAVKNYAGNSNVPYDTIVADLEALIEDRLGK